MIRAYPYRLVRLIVPPAGERLKAHGLSRKDGTWWQRRGSHRRCWQANQVSAPAQSSRRTRGAPITDDLGSTAGEGRRVRDAVASGLARPLALLPMAVNPSICALPSQPQLSDIIARDCKPPLGPRAESSGGCEPSSEYSPGPVTFPRARRGSDRIACRLIHMGRLREGPVMNRPPTGLEYPPPRRTAMEAAKCVGWRATAYAAKFFLTAGITSSDRKVRRSRLFESGSPGPLVTMKLTSSIIGCFCRSAVSSRIAVGPSHTV